MSYPPHGGVAGWPGGCVWVGPRGSGVVCGWLNCGPPALVPELAVRGVGPYQEASVPRAVVGLPPRRKQSRTYPRRAGLRRSMHRRRLARGQIVAPPLRGVRGGRVGQSTFGGPLLLSAARMDQGLTPHTVQRREACCLGAPIGRAVFPPTGSGKTVTAGGFPEAVWGERVCRHEVVSTSNFGRGVWQSKSGLGSQLVAVRRD